jgi:predicted dehydrogenase
VLSIISPTAQRAALFAILEARKPVLVEKPLGCNLDEAEQLASMLANHPHMISLNRRFDPGVALARQWMSEQSPPRRADGVMLRRNRREEDFIWSTGVHLTDLMCFLVGEDKIGDIKIKPACGEVAEYVDVFGDDWSLRIHTGTHQSWRVIASKDQKPLFDKSADESTPGFERNGTLAETRAFLNSVIENQPMSPTAADALPGTRLTVGYAHDTKR